MRKPRKVELLPGATVRMSVAARNVIDNAARKQRMTRSDYIRHAALILAAQGGDLMYYNPPPAGPSPAHELARLAPIVYTVDQPLDYRHNNPGRPKKAKGDTMPAPATPPDAVKPTAMPLQAPQIAGPTLDTPPAPSEGVALPRIDDFEQYEGDPAADPPDADKVSIADCIGFVPEVVRKPHTGPIVYIEPGQPTEPPAPPPIDLLDLQRQVVEAEPDPDLRATLASANPATSRLLRSRIESLIGHPI